MNPSPPTTSNSSIISVLRSLNWPKTIFLVGIPLAATISLHWIPLRKETFWAGLVYAYLRALAVTAGRFPQIVVLHAGNTSNKRALGYHRLWAHKAYSANTALKLVFAIVGAGAGQDTIKKWCRDHRAHHRYVDTDKDPYSMSKGFFHAHIGWVLFEQSDPVHGVLATGRVDISDLRSDPIVIWQRKYYLLLLFLAGYLAPTLYCGLLYDDYLGGFVFAGCIATALEQQGTFCVNSVAHWYGSQPYATDKTPRDNPLTGLLTLGEGYHNFHHEFPIDYRNGVRWHDFDPTKWVIWLCSQFGLATNLRRFPQNEIEKGRIQRKREKLDEDSEKVNWGVPLEELPVMEWEEFEQQARTGCNLIVIRGAVHDVSAFVTEHPGGASMITGAIGKDATEMFEGGVYGHSNAASNLLDTMRIAAIKKEVNVE
ncbi:Acyl-CoA desaturase [Penicillium cataractarum]|uniref:Acyl-CoA desaturase n=1 Tax=Penicillium cataractarum TaxID=2100454 RepID=A0A9W9RQ04_9EURO|nr:Acyl-CoA desaturase [Penicillium cataractarum]KAJ5364278.1 Acyl-CoA desaturase [Penicillium cataractarum]